jgi:hypothetical protein
MSQKLAGKIALITGGNSGIGLATAQRFVAEGTHIFITGRRQSALDAAVKAIGSNVTSARPDIPGHAGVRPPRPIWQAGRRTPLTGRSWTSWRSGLPPRAGALPLPPPRRSRSAPGRCDNLVRWGRGWGSRVHSPWR